MKKVKFTKNGHETELKDEIAKAYEKAGRVEILTPAKSPKKDEPKKAEAGDA